MEKEIVKLNVVEETLFIPLYMRAKESARKNGIIFDETACKLIKQIDYDFTKFDSAPKSELGCVIRCRHFDQKVQRFINKYNNSVVVNIGCGLDARYQRIKEKADAVFYDLDLPSVIALREKLMPPQAPANITISASFLDTKWMDELKSKHPNSPFIFIIEGVVMYFYKEQVVASIKQIADRFKNFELHFDVVGPLLVRTGIKPDSLNDSSVQMRFGISNGHLFEEWIPQIKLTDSISYLDIEKKRWGKSGFILRMIPGFARKFSSILGYTTIGNN